MLFVVIRVCGSLPRTMVSNFGSSELRELAIAWFLTWYLISNAVRLRLAVPATQS